MLECLDPDTRRIARPLLPWLGFQLPSRGPAGSALPGASAAAAAAAWALEATEAEALIQRPPRPEARAKLYMVSDETLTKHVSPADPSPSVSVPALANLTYLNLHDCGLRRIEGLSGLREVRTLLLTFNELSRMENLADLPLLHRLDLGHNALKRVEGIKGLTTLLHLDLSSNQVCVCPRWRVRVRTGLLAVWSPARLALRKLCMRALRQVI